MADDDGGHTTDNCSHGTTSIKMPKGFVGAVEGVGSGTGWGEASKGIHGGQDDSILSAIQAK